MSFWAAFGVAVLAWIVAPLVVSFALDYLWRE